MEVLVAGAHGKIGLRLLRLLTGRGHRGRGLIRNPDHAAELDAAGAEPVLCDLEADDVRPHVGAAEAIVFTAGAGPGSGDERKRTVDLGGAVKCVEAAEALGVARFVIVSSIGAQDPEGGPEAMRPYLRAKAEADERVRASGLEWTVVRPGSLTDDPGTGRVALYADLGHRGSVPRDDVALVLVECLEGAAALRQTFELFAGEVPAAVALRQL